MTTMDFESPRLVAEIDGTHARFALEIRRGVLRQGMVLACDGFPDFVSAVRAYLERLTLAQPVIHAAVAIANPVVGDWVQMTNHDWHFSIEQARDQLGLTTLVVVNDFTALASAIPKLGRDQLRQVGGGLVRENSVLAVLGAGTGLGVSGLVPGEQTWTSLGSEGGHCAFSPCDEREDRILAHVRCRFAHVSFERLLSSSGLQLIHEALACDGGAGAASTQAPDAAQILRLALEGEDALCMQVVDAFCCMLGTVAANLAVTLGAFGGVYIGGEIVQRLGERFDRSGFRARFESKGRFRAYVSGIPTFVITDEDAALRGAAEILEMQLRRVGPGSSVLDRIRRARDALTKAERRVADRVLEMPRQVLNEPIAEIARLADVSQPTVIRFCRSLGCDGLSDFKLRLASGLAGSVAVTHSQVHDDDSMLDLGTKVLDNTSTAIRQVRESLGEEALEQALTRLLEASRVEFFALSHYGMVAQDAHIKFLRLGVPSGVHTDAGLLRPAAAVLRRGDAAVFISASGSAADLIEAAEQARAQGAVVIAISGSHTPLARRADLTLVVDHAEEHDTPLVMISRILYLLVIDVLALGVALRRGLHGQVVEAAKSRETPAPAQAGAMGEPPPPAASTDSSATAAPHQRAAEQAAHSGVALAHWSLHGR